MRLKFDRLINITLMSESVRVPKDELWKITMYMSPNNTLKIDGIPMDYGTYLNSGFVSGGTEIQSYKGWPKMMGIAFKVVKEE